MADFNPLEGRILVVSNGVYKHANLFERQGRIFAKIGQGFVAVKADGSTSKHRVFWKDLELDQPTRNHIGNLILIPHDRPSTRSIAAK